MSKVLMQLKKQSYDLNAYVQVVAGDMYDTTASFTRRKRAKITRNGTALTGTCNGIKSNCNTYDDLTLTMDQKLEVNEKYADCDFSRLTTAERKALFTEFVKDWTEMELTGIYSLIGGTDLTEAIAAETSIVNFYDEVLFGVKRMLTNGYRREDLIIVINESAAIDLDALDLACCDMGVRTNDNKSTLAKKLRVRQVIELPANVISGVDDASTLTPETTVKFRIYAYEETKYGVSCKLGIDIRELSGDEMGQQIIGKENYGFSIFNADDSEVHAFEAVEETPEA